MRLASDGSTSSRLFGHIRALIAVGVLIAVLAPAALAHDHANLPNRERVEPAVRLDVGVGEKGTLPLYVSVRQSELGEKSGFGVKLWVDTVQVYVDESVLTDRHSFTLDLKKIGPGYHYLLANLCDHRDHIGAGAVWIYVSEDLSVLRYPDAPPELIKRWREGDTDWPGKLKSAITPTDPIRDDSYLNCCGEYSPWPNGANALDYFKMKRP